MVGVDIVNVERIKNSEDALVNRILSKAEQQYLNTKSKVQTKNGCAYYNTLAGFYSAKEAVLKAFKLGITGINLNEVEILHYNSGAPYVKLSDNLLKKCGINSPECIHISISHDANIAICVCIVG